MIMSPEDIFASQMWTWPDPALKRDSMGRVLFVNAAFLQMYGGNIDDWRGNVVTGWPTPQPPGLSNRFETRNPTPEGEQVYDWMEFTQADGSGFAMARNVTYLFEAPNPDPGLDANAPILGGQVADVRQDYAQTSQAPEQQVPAEQPVQPEQPVYLDPQEQEAPALPEQQFAPVQEQTYVEQPVYEQAPDPIVEAAQSISHPEIDTSPNIAVPEFEEKLAEVAEEHTEQVAPQVPVQQETVADVYVQPEAPQETEDRAYERRTLPIENGSAVLGNNWRDAVIAKAVGAEAPASAEEEPAEEPAPVAAEENASGSIRILLAEDNAINALLTRTLLEAEGHVVETVEDGALAVEAMKTSTFDLIFMDMRMPNMDGLEATRKIRAMGNVSKSLPIIALTANAFDDDRNACFDSGMNDFMTKPVSAEELSEMVKTWTKHLRDTKAA